MLDPDDGLLAVDNDPQKAVLAGLGRLEPGFGLLTIYYGETATLDEAETLARKVREARARRRRRGGPRRPAALPVPRLRRVSGGGAQRRSARRPRAAAGRSSPRSSRPAPATLDELLASPVGQSGIPQVAGLRRVARRLGVDTVRDLLFHLPAPVRRPARAAARWPTSATSTTAAWRRRRSASSTSRVQQTWRRRVQVTTARLTDGTGFAERDLVRPPVHRAPRHGRRRAPDLGQGQAPQRRPDVRGPGVPAGRRRQPAPRRPHRARLPAHRPA